MFSTPNAVLPSFTPALAPLTNTPTPLPLLQEERGLCWGEGRRRKKKREEGETNELAVKFLLGGGASFTLVDDGGRTCLHYACYVHDIPVIRLLYDAITCAEEEEGGGGVSISLDSMDLHRMTPLHAACSHEVWFWFWFWFGRGVGEGFIFGFCFVFPILTDLYYTTTHKISTITTTTVRKHSCCY